MIKLKKEMEDRPFDTLNVPAIEAILKEIKDKYSDVFNTISTKQNEIVLHLDNADAELHITTSWTYCESYVVMYLKDKHIETKNDVKQFVSDTIQFLEDRVK